ncbi:UNVERIFIED_CONTAM: hypothetical protein PYX00_001697 [Menopon gallinae]|uniref:Sister chromatid cohesion protein DCC1 n=1 Tax=Menopon gallinae TaxID=328185 RepID=A0AAW2IEF8_9NEOP
MCPPTNQYTKQDINEVCPVTQRLYFPSQGEYLEAKSNIKLLDFDEQFVERLQSGESLVFKGNGDEKLVFCTEDETYEVKEGEISNSLVICPEFLYNEDIKKINGDKRKVQKQLISGIYHSYLELRLTFPKLRKLRKFLAPTVYTGPDHEDNVSNKGYYLTELLENIQCSREELLNGLKDISACCIDGRWRLLSLKYESAVLSLIVGLMEEQGSNLINKKDAKKILGPKVPDFITDHILTNFATCSEDDNDVFLLKEDKVSRCFAEALLTAAGGTFLLDEFMKTWKASLPPGMEVNLHHLRGLALTEKGKSDEDVICLFQEYNLPENISERFRLLFKRKEKWSFDEIMPYIEKLATKAMNVNALLTKFSRASTVNGVRVFGARHAN